MPDTPDSSSLSTPRLYSAGLSGKAGLLDETLTVLQLVAQGQGPVELRSSVLESDVLGKATHENRRSIWDKLHQRYLADWPNAVRPRLLTALLHLGDNLDLDYRRVDLEQLKLLSLSPEQALDYWLHHYVSGVQINDEYVRISYRVPTD